MQNRSYMHAFNMFGPWLSGNTHPLSSSVLANETLFLQLTQGALGGRTLGDAIVATDSAERALAEHLHRDANATTVGKFLRFAAIQEKNKKNTQKNEHVVPSRIELETFCV